MVRVKRLARGVAGWGSHHALQSDGARIAAGFASVPVNALDGAPGIARLRHAAGQPAVPEPADPAVRDLGVAADPDRQAPALWRLRLHGHGHRGVVRPDRAHLCVTPVGPEQADGLVHARASRLEALAERVVLRFLPAHSDPQAHPSARKGVERADLLGDEGRLALRQHQHFGAEGDARGHGGHVGERRQGLENRHRGIVWAGRPPLHGDAHHHVVEDVDVIVADPLDGGGEAADRGRPFAVADARELDGELQGCLLRTIFASRAKLRQATGSDHVKVTRVTVTFEGCKSCTVCDHRGQDCRGLPRR